MAESLATVMAEAIEFWQTYSSMNEPAQDDIAHEKNAMLERMQAALNAAADGVKEVDRG